VEVSAATPATGVSAEELAGVAAFNDTPSHGIAGGNQSLALALAAVLGDRVHLRAPVHRIAADGDGVVVGTEGGELRADAAVIAVPASVIDAIEFDPGLPPRHGDALAGVRYGHAAKLFVPLGERPSPSAVLSVPGRYWTWTACGADGVQPVLHCFAGSGPALERLAVGEGCERWLASVAALRPDLQLVPEDALLSTWSDDPWARAAYSVHPPGGADPVLTEPFGRLVLAGEHTAGPYAALMDGALRSGLRAAEQVAGIVRVA
jgi:monoamine oxidase